MDNGNTSDREHFMTLLTYPLCRYWRDSWTIRLTHISLRETLFASCRYRERSSPPTYVDLWSLISKEVVVVFVLQYPARRLQCIAWIRAARGFGYCPVVYPTGGRLVLPDRTDRRSDRLQGGRRRRPHLWGQVALVVGVARRGLPGPSCSSLPP